MSAFISKPTKPIDWLTAAPIAHRGLHNTEAGVPENTLAAARAAVTQGYGIEVDLHLAKDGVPVVFHDQTLERLIGIKSKTRAHTSAELGEMAIAGTTETIPTLHQLIKTVDGRVPLVLELKGLAGEDDGFVASVADALTDYAGPVAIMSFNHWLLRDARAIAPQFALGLTAEGDQKLNDTHTMICDETAPDFLSYSMRDLDNPFVADFRDSRPVICWTVRSPEEAAWSLERCDQITFEGFLA